MLRNPKLSLSCLGLIAAIASGICGFFISFQNPPQENSLTSAWEFAYQRTGEEKIRYGGIYVRIVGDRISGEGHDDSRFEIHGKFLPPKVTFTRQDIVDGKPSGAPQLYLGRLTSTAHGPPLMEGIILTRKHVLNSVCGRSYATVCGGKWQAQQLPKLKKGVFI